jgi:hypothetical protein
MYNKYSEKYVPITPVKGGNMYSIDDEDFYTDDKFHFEKDEDNTTTKNSEPKNYNYY